MTAALALLLVAGCGMRNTAAALEVSREMNARACEASRMSRASAYQAADDADIALVAAQRALTSASVKGQRPRASVKAALWDQANDGVRTAEDRLREAKEQAVSAGEAEERACRGG